MTIRKLDNLFTTKIDDLKLPNIVAFMTDLMTSEDKARPITCGLFKQGAGEPCPYTYEAEEYKILLDGELTVANDKGEVYDLKPGDGLFFGKGEKVQFSSKSFGLAFYVAQR
jgi:uncharacterized cupin superfamily protein